MLSSLVYQNNHIDIEVKVGDAQPWRLTGIYGEPNKNLRRRTWDILSKLARYSNLPWCVIRDWNNILIQSEKKGGVVYPQVLIDGFNNILEEIKLTDIELCGQPYTWERGRNTEAWMEIRRYLAMVSRIWGLSFPLAKLYNVEGSPSDHSPIFIDIGSNLILKQKRIFKFENAWLLEPLCAQIVKSSWEEDANLNIMHKVQHRGENFDHWGREITCCFSKRIKECKMKLKQLRVLWLQSGE